MYIHCVRKKVRVGQSVLYTTFVRNDVTFSKQHHENAENRPRFRNVACEKNMPACLDLLKLKILGHWWCCGGREKKHSADQRIAELQALIALTNGAPSSSGGYGHGFVDPFYVYVISVSSLAFMLAVYRLCTKKNYNNYRRTLLRLMSS